MTDKNQSQTLEQALVEILVTSGWSEEKATAAIRRSDTKWDAHKGTLEITAKAEDWIEDRDEWRRDYYREIRVEKLVAAEGDMVATLHSNGWLYVEEDGKSREVEKIDEACKPYAGQESTAQVVTVVTLKAWINGNEVA